MGYDGIANKELGFGCATFTELAAKFGIHRTTAKRRLEKAGIVIPAWNEQQIAILKEEWAKGTTCSDIANMVNKTRNSVIGKAHRLKLEGRDVRNQYHPASTAIIAERPKKKRVRKKPAPKVQYVDLVAKEAKKTGGRNAPVYYPPALPLADLPPVHLMELRRTNCRAIVGHGPDGLATYCGADVFPGKSFCPGHCAMYYAPPKERRFA